MAISSINSNSRCNILDVLVSPVNISTAVASILKWIERKERHYVCVTGVHGVMECQRDENLKKIHNLSGMAVPDGMPLVWAGKIYGFSKMDRVYGPDLMIEVSRASVKKNFTHFLYGGEIGIAEKLKDCLERKFPGIKVKETFTPPFRPLNEEEEKELIQLVDECKPDIFWVGLSTPKQERFMAEYLPKLDVKVMVGVGAAFDILTGRTKDAPNWIKKIGMQWFFRLCQEPRRLWKRYLYNNPVFVYKFTRQLLRDKVFKKGTS